MYLEYIVAARRQVCLQENQERVLSYQKAKVSYIYVFLVFQGKKEYYLMSKPGNL